MEIDVLLIRGETRLCIRLIIANKERSAGQILPATFAYACIIEYAPTAALPGESTNSIKGE